MYDAKILADSISNEGCRLTTFQVTFPRFILAEVNTHRMLSRNSASSRAIPIKKSIRAVREDPFYPEVFGSNQKGMSAGDPVSDQKQARGIWEAACGHAVMRAEMFDTVGVHKSLGNRVLEPYKWHTAILSATDWHNFFALRCAKNAQPEFRTIAEMMKSLYLNHEPRELSSGELHVPLVSEDEIDDEANSYPEPWVDWEMWGKVSIGRCARVSYLTHDGKRDLAADIDLYNRLKEDRHLSPFEHVARPYSPQEWAAVDSAQNALQLLHEPDLPDFVSRLCRQLEYSGNYHGWVQQRAGIPDEHDASLVA